MIDLNELERLRKAANCIHSVVRLMGTTGQLTEDEYVYINRVIVDVPSLIAELRAARECVRLLRGRGDKYADEFKALSEYDATNGDG